VNRFVREFVNTLVGVCMHYTMNFHQRSIGSFRSDIFLL